MKNLLITGGLGFIGSHTVCELYTNNNNFNVIILDNLCNSSIEQIKLIEKIIYPNKIIFVKGSINDSRLLDSIFINYHISAVIHFAALKSVTESINEPLLYYNNNVCGTINLLTIMNKYNVHNFIFSSSATVYGNQKSPIVESDTTGHKITNPYGKSKFIIEEMLKDLNGWNICILRYFNPIGAHTSGLIGENPNGIPNNLMPYILNVGKNTHFNMNDTIYQHLKVYGLNYDTVDGSGVRDYIHVVDLANAHIKSLEKILLDEKKVSIYNLGTGKGTSVLELIKCFEDTNNIKIPYEIYPNRPGDIAESYCDVSKAEIELGWKRKYTIKEMCLDSWNYVLHLHKSFQC
jgi:UDP-glucose 4-epimerase